MKVLGIEFDADRMNYVLVGADGEIATRGKITLLVSRDALAIRSFDGQLRQLLDGMSPGKIAIKAKPENGQMRAGASALKMEALLIAASACEVVFVSPQRLSKVDGKEGLFEYLQGAWKAAVVGRDFAPVNKPKTAKNAPSGR